MRRKGNDLESFSQTEIHETGNKGKISRSRIYFVLFSLSIFLLAFSFLSSSETNKQNFKEHLNLTPFSNISSPAVLGSIPSDSLIDCAKEIPDKYFTNTHIVSPPDGPVILVCCGTTAGTLNIAVHPNWAPIGASRFLDMIESDFFSTRVALFRAIEGFLVQFGLAGNREMQEKFDTKGNLRDDPTWLPLGPPGRVIDGIPRFQKGYISYAGAGKDTRGTQMFISFENNEGLGGGSPWEVPFGQLLDDVSYKTLSKIYTGYGESPEQGKIRNRGNVYLEEEFPLIDYIQTCTVMKKGIPWKYAKYSQ